MTARVCGADPEDLRAMVIGWYVEPLARALLRGPYGHRITFLVGADGSGVRHRFSPSASGTTTSATWDAEVDRCRRELFGWTGDGLAGDAGFARAFAPFCPADGSFVPYAVLRVDARTNRDPKDAVPVDVEVVGVRRCDDHETEAAARHRARWHGRDDDLPLEVMIRLDQCRMLVPILADVRRNLDRLSDRPWLRDVLRAALAAADAIELSYLGKTLPPPKE